MATWLLTGGAGYIGGHIVAAMRASGRDVVVVDDLSTGDRAVVPDDVPLIEASIADESAVQSALRDHAVTGVIHLAAKKAVAESVADPLLYWRENVEGMRSLLASMSATGVDRIVYSSSAAVYGTPPADALTGDGLVREDIPLHPESPYGETKLAGEWMLRALAAATGMSYVALRYFNVAGTGSPALADRGAHNLIPLILSALASGRPPQVFGDDYPTRDGTCIRDYIHVADLADAHVAAVAALEQAPRRATYNVGRGDGVTVKEVMVAMQQAVGHDFEYVIGERRPGDPAAYAAVATRIGAELGWQARLDLAAMVGSAVEAWRARGGGEPGDSGEDTAARSAGA
jgi:UDP-glucose 4-epimerase